MNIIFFLLGLGDPAVADKVKVLPPPIPAVAQRLEPVNLDKIHDYHSNVTPKPKDIRFKVWIVYNNECPEDNSNILRSVLNDKVKFYNKKANDQYQRLRKKVLSNLDFVIIDGNDEEQRWNHKVPFYHAYYPLFKTNKRGKWQEFPKDERVVLGNPFLILEWLDYQRVEYEYDWYYGMTVSSYQSIKHYQLELRQNRSHYILKIEKDAFRFLCSKGVNPNAYAMVASDSKYINTVSRPVYLYNKTQVKRWYYLNGVKGPKRSYMHTEYKWIKIQDHDFIRIKKDYPDFKLPDPFVYHIEYKNPKPWWSDREYSVPLVPESPTPFNEIRVANW